MSTAWCWRAPRRMAQCPSSPPLLTPGSLRRSPTLIRLAVTPSAGRLLWPQGQRTAQGGRGQYQSSAL
ncbi:hypothetical protein E2C01_048830 [Portunus trituberculatus]|uniref:Uncharacterized protein n=1 Tax=Portunus trituberculatus TaxID=210409 RepID=A0A5B7G4R2_PORTR|nr:hypothetical protein [Portunus trituberculatus]